MHIVPLITLLIIITQSCATQVSHTDAPVYLNLDSLIANHIEEKKIPSIAIGIVKDGESIVSKAYGYANLDEKINADEHTLYQLGSVTKMFTGHLLASMIHQDQLSLSDTLSHFFPEVAFPMSPTGQSVTIQHIATHSSEFPRYPANLQRIDPHPIRGYTRNEMKKGIEMIQIDTLLGVRYNYSNFGYGVLGSAIENHMHQSLDTLMKEYIFSKYKMNSTSLVIDENHNSNLAIPYLAVNPPVRTEPWQMGKLSAAGNLFSNISDLNKFMIALLEQTGINEIQQTRYLRINDSWSYGLGCFVIDSESKNTRIIYHGGDIDGYASSLTLYPQYQLGFVILTNWGEGPVIGNTFTAISDRIVDYYLNPQHR